MRFLLSAFRHICRLVYLIRRVVLGLSRFLSVMGDTRHSLRDADDTNVMPTDNTSRHGRQVHSSNWTEDSDSDDSLICEYDSTWDEDFNYVNEGKPIRKKQRWLWSQQSGRNTRAAQDMQRYRHEYPDQVQPAPCQVFRDYPNLSFYQNKAPSKPDGFYIEDFHNNWWGDYARLEKVHTFVQWLFPLQEEGMNYAAHTLTKDEIKAFIADDEAKKRLRISYILMLDFYGVILKDYKTGEVGRAPHWRERFRNLNRHTHNNLRITRILKCLGTLGFQHYQAPLVRFFLVETLRHGELENVKSSALDYFLFSVRDKSERRKLMQEAFVIFHQQRQVRGRRSLPKFVWCPKLVQKKFLKELEMEATNLKDPAANSALKGAASSYLYETLKAEWSKENLNLTKCGEILRELKTSLVELNFLPTTETELVKQELNLARDVLEIGALWSIQKKDSTSFEGYMAQLKGYYFDYKEHLPESADMHQLLGLNLLFLLSQNRLSEFHTELERLTAKDIQNNVYIRHPVSLEQYLMEGSYNKVILAEGNIPSESYTFFMDILLNTVRDEIAGCIEKAYEKIQFTEATRMLSFSSEKMTEYSKKRGWTESSDGYYSFSSQHQDTKELTIPSTELAQQAFEYARQLEMIV